MAGLLAPYIPDSSKWLQSHALGYEQGEAIRNRDLTVQAGGQAAEGDLTGARSTLYGGGNFAGANQITQLLRQADNDALAKTERFHQTLGNLALAADTPDKWGTAIDTLGKAGLDVSKYKDFGTRDMVLAQSGKTLEAIGLENDRRKQALDAERQNQLAADERANKATELSIKQQAVDAKSVPKVKPLPVSEINKLAESGQQLENVDRYVGSFKNEHAGYGVGGDTAMWLARNASILTGPKTEDAANWWQDYDRYKNVVRNKLFGSALTVGEQAAFEKADINPNMDPKLIRQNLDRQRESVKSALRKSTGALKASGYPEEAIDAATGVDASQLAPDASTDADAAAKDTGRIAPTPGAPTSKAYSAAVPPQALQLLRTNPSPQAMQQFDEVFGQGAAAKALGR